MLISRFPVDSTDPPLFTYWCLAHAERVIWCSLLSVPHTHTFIYVCQFHFVQVLLMLLLEPQNQREPFQLACISTSLRSKPLHVSWLLCIIKHFGFGKSFYLTIQSQSFSMCIDKDYTQSITCQVVLLKFRFCVSSKERSRLLSRTTESRLQCLNAMQ